MRARLGLVAVMLPVLAAAAPASAAITPTREALPVAQAIVDDAATLRGAAWVTMPAEIEGSEQDNPAALVDAPLAGFPLEGSTSAALLSSGDALLVDDANDSGSTGFNLGGDNNVTDAEGVNRGDTAFDVTILRLDLTAPANTNCLSFQFRFLSDEYPEFVGSNYNDAFIAELDKTSWTTSQSQITAPNNFAFDPIGNVISINATGGESVAPEDSVGTTFDAATQILIASAPVTAGDHSLYLSIFDQGDQIYDAAAFVDKLTFTNQPEGACEAGAVVNEFEPPVTTTQTTIPPFTQNGVIEFIVSDGARGSGPKAVHYKLNGGAEQVIRTSSGKATLTLENGQWALEFWGEDRRGNQEATHHFANVTVDNVAPVLTLENLQRTNVFSEGAAVFLKVAASDPLAGLGADPSNARLALDTSTVGPKSIGFTAIDRAGNQSTASFAYTVAAVPLTSVIALQSARRCVSRRKFTIRVRRKPDMVIASTVVKVGKRKARTFRGRRATAPINLRGLTGRRTIRVRVTVTTSTGKKFTLTRKYKICRAKRR